MQRRLTAEVLVEPGKKKRMGLDDRPRTITQPPAVRLPVAGEEIWNGDRRYWLGECLGQGYFGQVYACRDRWLNDLVVKVLLPRNQTYEEVRLRWHGELQNLLALRHPNVTYVYDAFEYQTTFFLVVERCAEELTSLFSLPGYDGNAWLPAIARDVLQALAFIHDAGYVHKDLHTGNILIGATRDRADPSKRPVHSFKVADLGISRLDGDPAVFDSIFAQWMMPPEALSPADFGPIGKAVDIYHVGLVFLSVLLGYVPTFSHQEILAGTPRQIAERLHSPYGPLIGRALRRHTSERPQSAGAFWDELLQLTPLEAVPA